MEETKTGVEFGKLKLTWNVENDDRYENTTLKTKRITFKEYPGCYIVITMGDSFNSNESFGANFMIDDIIGMMTLSNCGYHLFTLIEDLYVAHELRGKGAARNMIEELIEYGCTDDRILFARAQLLHPEYTDDMPEAKKAIAMGSICGWFEYNNFVSMNSFNQFEYSRGFVFRNYKSRELIKWLNENEWKETFHVKDDE